MPPRFFVHDRDLGVENPAYTTWDHQDSLLGGLPEDYMLFQLLFSIHYRPGLDPITKVKSMLLALKLKWLEAGTSTSSPPFFWPSFLDTNFFP
ncbi:hypothetical protein TSUD_309010 [Trifolium subterraneum]|nr:hypothetical protein TSUD_309010 [Trifolium subterraneum]